jgi:hypothetical protein
MVASADEAPTSHSGSPRLGTWPYLQRQPSGAGTIVDHWSPDLDTPELRGDAYPCASVGRSCRRGWGLRLGDGREGEGYGYEAAATPGVRAPEKKRRWIAWFVAAAVRVKMDLRGLRIGVVLLEGSGGLMGLLSPGKCYEKNIRVGTWVHRP